MAIDVAIAVASRALRPRLSPGLPLSRAPALKRAPRHERDGLIHMVESRETRTPGNGQFDRRPERTPLGVMATDAGATTCEGRHPEGQELRIA